MYSTYISVCILCKWCSCFSLPVFIYLWKLYHSPTAQQVWKRLQMDYLRDYLRQTRSRIQIQKILAERNLPVLSSVVWVLSGISTAQIAKILANMFWNMPFEKLENIVYWKVLRNWALSHCWLQHDSNLSVSKGENRNKSHHEERFENRWMSSVRMNHFWAERLRTQDVITQFGKPLQRGITSRVLEESEVKKCKWHEKNAATSHPYMSWVQT
jgi:hypothetical protein